MNRNVILGVDVGVASLGACIVEVDDAGRPVGFLDGFSFIYPTPDGAAERRGHRAMRRGYRRKRNRLRDLRAYLVETLKIATDFDGKPDGIKDPAFTDIAMGDDTLRDDKGHRLISPNSRTRLRALGLSEALSATDLARAILHIAKNRGMRLTRVIGTSEEDEKARKEASVMVEQARATRREMAAQNAQTPGMMLWLREQAAPAPHQRHPLHRRVGTSLALQFVRSQLEDELDALLAFQHPFHPALDADTCRTLHEKVFFEQEPPKPEIGRCLYNPETEERLPLACDLFQQKRIYEEVNNLRIEYADASRAKLTRDQRDLLVARLMAGEDLGVAKIKKLIGATERRVRLSLEGQAGRNAGPAKKLEGHAIRRTLSDADGRFAALGQGGAHMVALYDGLDEERRTGFEKLLRDEDDRDRMVLALMRDYAVAGAEAENAADGIALRRGYAATGLTATFEILEKLKADIIDSNTAAEQAGLVAASAREMVCKRLPYYGEVFPHLVRGRMSPETRGYPAATIEEKFGRIPNPVVHVALNSLRKVVNALVKKGEKQGWVFKRVQIEMARDMKKTQEDRDKDSRRIAREQAKNAEYDAITLAHQRPASRKNRRKLKLWEAQNRMCPYTGLSIDVADLFSGKFDIDHTLPRSKTLDDSLYNLLVIHENVNKAKGNKSPFEAFAGGLNVAGVPARSYEQIVETVRRIPGIRHKEKLFRPDAMDRFEDQDAFARRYKTDTSYIAKAAKQYLQCVFPHLRPTGGVEAINGFITDDLRKRWGVMDLVQQVAHQQDPDLVEAPPTKEERADGTKRGKNRDDHRHHLLDAAVTACTPRDVVQKLQTISASRAKHDMAERYRVPLPWADFRDDLYELIDQARTTHRPNRELNGKLHMATNLGVVARFADGRYLVRQRKRFDPGEFSSLDDVKKKLVVDPALMARLEKDMTAGQAVLFWAAREPLADLQRHHEMLGDIAGNIERLFALQPSEATYEDVDRKTGAVEIRTRKVKEDERLAAAFAAYRDECLTRGLSPRRTVRLYGLDEAVMIAGGDSGKLPSRTFKPGSNAWLDIFRDGSGKPGFEVVRTIDAMRPGYVPQWQQHDSNDLLLRLFKGDTVRLRSKDGKTRLCVLATNSPGDWEFQPLNLSSHISRHPARKNFRFGFKALCDADPQLVVRDVLGRIVYETSRLNW